MRNRFAAVLSAALSAAFLAATGEEIRVKSAVGKSGEPVPFAEGSDLAVASSYDDAGYRLVFTGKGGPKASDVGGSLTVQVRAGLANADGERAPTAVRFVFDGDGGYLTDLCRGPQVRDMRRTVPAAAFSSGNGRWTLVLSADWFGNLDRLPFTGKGPRIGHWRMTAVYRGADGAEVRLGTAEEPARIVWERPKTLVQAYSSIFSEKGLGDGLWDYYALWNWSWKERWVGYPDAGRETFRWRDAQSEMLFHTRVIERIRRETENAIRQLHSSKKDPARKVPEILRKGTPEEKDAMFAKLPALRDVRDDVHAARRAYLLDRFVGRIPPALPPEVRKASAAKADTKVLPRAKFGESSSDDNGGLTLDE